MNKLLLFLIPLSLFIACSNDEISEPNTPILTTNIDFTDTIKLLIKGRTYPLNYSIKPQNASSKNVIVRTSASTIIEISKGDSLVALNRGSAYIIISSTDGSQVYNKTKYQVAGECSGYISNISKTTSHSTEIKFVVDDGDDTNASGAIFWSTSSILDTLNCVGKLHIPKINNDTIIYTIENLEPNKQYYAWSNVKNSTNSVTSTYRSFRTTSFPNDYMGNSSLNLIFGNGKVISHNDYLYYITADMSYNYLMRKDKDLKNETFIRHIGSSFNLYSLTSYNNNLYGIFMFDLAKFNQITNDFEIINPDNDQASTFSYRGGFTQLGETFFSAFQYFKISINNGISTTPTTKETDKSYENLNIVNDKVYGIEVSYPYPKNTILNIKEFDLNGNEIKLLYTGKRTEYYKPVLGAYQEDLYFIEESNLKKININNPSDVQILPISTDYLNIADDWIFFSNNLDNKKLYKCDLFGNNLTKLNDDLSTNSISIIDEYIYFYANSDLNSTLYHLYRIKFDGSGKELVW